MKNFLKQTLLFIFLFVVIFTNISGSKSNWSGMDLSLDEINSSIHFQLVRGSTCVGELQKLKPVLDRFITQKIDSSYLNNILGKPNNILSSANGLKYQYYLTANPDANTLVITIQNGSVFSYTIENSHK